MVAREVEGGVIYEAHGASGHIVVVVADAVAQAVMAPISLVEVEAEQKSVEAAVI